MNRKEKELISKCLICSSNTDELFDKQLKVTYDICQNCGFISKQKDYHLSHQEEKVRYSKHQNFPDNEGYVNIFMNMINLHVKGLKNVKTILDFGSGPYPTLKILLQREGYDVTIFDPYFHNDLTYRNKKYDLIVSTEVFEHFSDPISEIKELLELIRDDGYLCIMTNFRTMNTEDFLNWYYRRDHTHVSFFNNDTFQYIKKKFNVLEISNNNKNIIVFQKK